MGLFTLLFFKRLGIRGFHDLFNQYQFFFSKHGEYCKTEPHLLITSIAAQCWNLLILTEVREGWFRISCPRVRWTARCWWKGYSRTLLSSYRSPAAHPSLPESAQGRICQASAGNISTTVAGRGRMWSSLVLRLLLESSIYPCAADEIWKTY